jgi:transposase-like protein
VRIILRLALENEIDEYIEKTKPLRDEEDKKCCELVVIGVNKNRNKEFLTIENRIRESTLSLKKAILELRERGMEAPKLAISAGFLVSVKRDVSTNKRATVLGA